ncbi:MAG: putative modified peptide, partial [Conexibacter sp.]|nr:putative modified peptide [Conexibacter sp.]
MPGRAVQPRETTAAARLLERLLADPDLRARFRRDPVGTTREAGIDSLAEELAEVPGDPMVTLHARESRSSLAGVMMAAAMEGVGVFQLADQVASAHAAPHAAAQVLAQVRSPP